MILGAMDPIEQLPAYHEGLMVVKMRPEAAALAATFVNTPQELPSANTGLLALSLMQRAGIVTRVTPLVGAAGLMSAPAGVPSAMGAIMQTAGTGDEITAGVGFIQLEQQQDLRHLQQAMASDPAVVSAGQVAARYAVFETPGAEADEQGGGETQGQGMGPLAVPPPAVLMWNLRKIRWAEARTLPGFQDAQDIRVGVLDTGVNRDHPDLAGIVSGYRVSYPDLPVAPSDQDIVGHGTHVAGTIAARINNNVGINGICNPQLFAWKIFNDVPIYFENFNVYGYQVDPVLYRRALADCIDNTEVINLSIGGTGEPDAIESTLYQTLFQRDKTVVAAMGNFKQFGSPTTYPAAIPSVIAVGATGPDDKVTSFSNSGRHISLCAPGVAIWSTVPTYPGQTGFQAIRGPAGDPAPGMPMRRETTYASMNGTSMAAPHVTAAAALLIAKEVAAGAALSPEQVEMQLTETADKVPDMHDADFSTDYGRGRLNLERLLS